MRRKLLRGAACFYFFEKKLQKRQISPRYIFEKILEKYKGVRRTPFFIKLDFPISGIFSLKHLSPDGGWHLRVER